MIHPGRGRKTWPQDLAWPKTWPGPKDWPGPRKRAARGAGAQGRAPPRHIVSGQARRYMQPMVVWFFLAVLTGAAVLSLLWPLSRRAASLAGAGHARDAETLFYHDQLREIDRDAARGLLREAEAEGARAEAGRRLLRACRTLPESGDPEGEPFLRRRRAASAFTVSTVPLVALLVYGLYGSPDLPSQALAGRVAAARTGEIDLEAAVARIEAHLSRDPSDGRGWEVLAPVYLRGGRAGESARAYETAIRLLGQTPKRLSDWGEALVAARDGMVSAEARAAFERALDLDAALVRPRLYLARAAEQDGDGAGARRRYEEMAATAPADAPWLALVRERIAALAGGTGEARAAIAALPDDERRAAIRGMVEGLDRRLAEGGGGEDEWSRLARSYGVLGDRAKARAVVERARAALGPDRAVLSRLDALAHEIDPPGAEAAR